jgi:hypothetical protein
VMNTDSAVLGKIMKLCRATSNLNGDGEDWLIVTGEAECNRKAACQHLDDKEHFQLFLECLTSSQVRMLNFLHFSTERNLSCS